MAQATEMFGSPQLIGKSDKAAILEVSPNGQWLLSWDGVVQNTPATNPGARLLWNLKTRKSRDISHWSREVELYDFPCGFTPDNRIWTLRTKPQPLADGNAPYAPQIFIENPDGSGKIICEDKSRHLVFDQKSYSDEEQDIRFSQDGKMLCVLSDSYFRRFDARTGKLIFRRRLGLRHRQERAANLSLSPDGSKIIASNDIWDFVDPKEVWCVYEAKSGRRSRTLPRPKGARNPSWVQDDIYLYWTDNALAYCRLQNGEVLWKEIFPAPTSSNAPLQQLVLQNPRSGKRRVLVPPSGKWKSLTVSPDRKTLYGVKFNGGIYKMTADAR